MTTQPDLPRNSQIVRLNDGVLPALPFSRPFDSPQESAEDLRAVELLDYWRVIIDRKRLVLGCGLAGALIGFLSLIPQPYVFKGKTTVELQGVNGNFMGMGQVDPQDSGSTTADSFVSTQIELLNSNSLRLRVADKLRREMPSTTVPQFSGWLGRLRAKGQAIARRQSRDPLVRLNQAIGKASMTMMIKPVGKTRVLEISCESTSPDVAAAFVNSLASEFIDQNLELRIKGIQRMGQWFSTQVQDSKEKLEKTEEKLRQYTGDPRAVVVGEERSVDPLMQSKLGQLQQQLSMAQSERIDRQTRYQMALSKSADAESLDPSLMAARLKLNQLKRDLEEMKKTLTPAHYRVKALQAQINDLETAMAKESEAIIGRAKADLETVEKKEALLAAAYNSQLRTAVGAAAASSNKAMEIALLKREIETNRQLYDIMLSQYNRAGIASGVPMESVRVVDPAMPSRRPSNYDEGLYAGLGLGTGLMGGFMLAVVLRSLDRSVKTPSQITTLLNVPELGYIPSNAASQKSARDKNVKTTGQNRPSTMDLIAWHEKPSMMAESFRFVLTSILHTQATSNHGLLQVMVVTSPHVQEGKSTVTSNLGISLAELNQKTLIIDADMRAPRQHSVFKLANEWGLSELLREETPVNDYPFGKLAQATEIPNLYVLPSGSRMRSSNAALNSKRFREVLSRLRNDFHTILIDTPPMMNFAEGRLLARLADGVVLVIRARVTNRDNAIAARRRLQEDGAFIVGAILNDWVPIGYHARMMKDYSKYYGSHA